MNAKLTFWIFSSVLVALFMCSCNTIISAFLPGTAQIHKAAEDGNVVEVKAILQDDPSQVNRKDKWGWTPLMHAAGHAQVNVVKLLVESGANIDQKDRKGISTLDIVTGHISICENLDATIINLQTQNPKTDIDKFRELFNAENQKKWEEILVILNKELEKETIFKKHKP